MRSCDLCGNHHNDDIIYMGICNVKILIAKPCTKLRRYSFLTTYITLAIDNLKTLDLLTEHGWDGYLWYLVLCKSVTGALGESQYAFIACSSVVL